MKRFRFVVCAGLLAVTAAQAKITLPSVVGDHMVLQQKTSVKLWGHSDTGKKVKIKASWGKSVVSAVPDATGYWEASLLTSQAGGPYEIELSDGDKMVLQDILIGEVWYCSGQSNMEMPVKGFRGQPVADAQKTILAASPKRDLRLFTVKRAFANTLQEELTGQWMCNSPEAVAQFSATAYFFGNQLQTTLGIPVGLVHASWSGSKIEPWMSSETLRPFSDIQIPDTSALNVRNANITPSALYNAMVYPLKNLAVKGIIWYQGESNSTNPAQYKALFSAWTAQMRSFFRNDSLPVFFAEIAPYRSSDKMGVNLPLFRECQLQSMHEIPNTGMAVLTDAGSEKFIHSPHKSQVGERLAYWALNRTYGIDGFSYRAPEFNSCKLQEGKVEVKFDYADNGLIPENAEIHGFELGDAAGNFYPASATIVNGSSRVSVWCDSVPVPVEVRYSFRNYYPGNLLNTVGIPVVAFRAKVQ